MKNKLTKPQKTINDYLQEDKVHIQISESLRDEINEYDRITKLGQFRIATELLLYGRSKFLRKYHLS